MYQQLPAGLQQVQVHYSAEGAGAVYWGGAPV